MNDVWNISNQLSIVDEAIDRAASMNDGEIPGELLEFFEALKTDFGMCVGPIADLCLSLIHI